MITASIITILVAMTVNPTTVPVFEVVNDLPAPIEAVETAPEAPADDAESPQEAEYVEETYWEPQWQVYGVTADYSGSNDTYWTESVASDGISAAEFQWLGVVSDESHTYTWYSERVLPGYGLTDLNENGRWSDGEFVRDGDGYIAVASCDYEKGTLIDTPFGAARVYDTGNLAPGQVDVYTSF